jgi:hypothetical protein
MKKIILLSVIYSIFFGCKKEEKPDYPYLEVSDEIWSYIQQTTNSWYIYKDSATGITDSVEVTYVDFKPRVFFGFPILHYRDDYTVALHKVDLSGNRIIWLYALSFSDVIPNNPNLPYWFFSSEGLILMQFPSNFPGSPSIYKIPSATIEGNVYSEIMVVASNSGVVWWVKGIGIVRLSRFVNGNIQTSLLLRKK